MSDIERINQIKEEFRLYLEMQGGEIDLKDEMIKDLIRYDEILLETNEHTNLISKSTLDIRWNRHFLDSYQLMHHIDVKQTASILDFGSGAGFPGLVLAIALKHHPVGREIKVIMVESIAKKAEFLTQVKEALGLDNAIIYNKRVEDIKHLSVDCITARAVTALENCLKFAVPFSHELTYCIFPKGAKYQEEIDKARMKFQFDCRKSASITSAEAQVLKITNIKHKYK